MREPLRGPAAAVVRRAHAKINVFLRVLGRREDGYHDIESLVVPVSLVDTITLRPIEDGARWVVTSGPAAEGVPEGDDNLALQAAEALARRCGTSRGALIEIHKRIPVAAGLGGGSADAAATLLGLNDLWRCRLALEELSEVGAGIGSDVPALLREGPVLIEGRGERVRPVPVTRMWWVLHPQRFPVSTPDAYRWWDEDPGTTGPDPAPVIEAAARGSAEELGPLLFDDLEPGVVRRHPQVARARERLLGAGALGVVMSGSGPTVAALAGDESQAREISRALPGTIAVAAPP